MKKTLTIDIISALLLLLLLYTGISKLVEYEKFRDVLSTSPLLSGFAGIISRLLPVLEIFIAILLFVPATRFVGLISSFVLLLFLTGYLIILVFFAPRLPCNCGGVISSLNWTEHIFFNLFFILIAAVGIYLSAKGIRRRSDAPT